ncbi:ABC transporter substrate-binding protein [Psychrobium sp. 1_MG-2023]|uniref:substrate-binding periplasmic protein n=1 Tax=Psychrobium sp. 1_MG-2023 TaxID=3062624 RepID=UPI000C31F771|nr:transporter substrate-binding domain-containing protein [Psychrobium sp. 1_MG-2023]MDP2559654.1 transporter substrate-binding domain-containing protein [Psychrobium sp. 1_MG-2023]PKF59485.1 hypothetical protein CW748_01565 [Alteromonadales bacterium alter-6D02]
MVKKLFFIGMILWGQAVSASTVEIASYYIPGLIEDEHSGSLVQLHQEVIKRAQLESKLVIMPAKRAQYSFKNGLISALFPTLRDKLPLPIEQVITSEPFWLKKIIIFSRKDFPLMTVEQLSGKKIAAVRGFSYGDSIENNPQIKIHYQKNDHLNIKSLMAGHVDAIIGDNVSTVYALQQSGQSQYVSYKDSDVIDVLDVFYVCLKNEQGQALCEQISQAIKTMKYDGTLLLDGPTGTSELNISANRLNTKP